MNLTERELKLILIALDNTAITLQDEATASGDEEIQKEVEDMDKLYNAVSEELQHKGEEK